MFSDMGSRNPNYTPHQNLGWLADNGYELEAHCTGCDRRQRIALHPLARRFGAFMSVAALSAKLKCGHCNRKMPELVRRRWDQEIDLPWRPSR